MRLPIHAISSFQCSCLEDVDQIWSFMERKTSEELRSRHSIRIWGGLRHTLQLQFNQMSSAWRQYSPNDDNGDNNGTVARLNRSIESTRVAVAHVLQSSGKAIVYRAPWRPEEYSDLDTCPNPYTSLAQFHHKVVPFAHRDSPYARQPPRLGGAAAGADYMPTCNGRPVQVTSLMTPGRDGKTTAQTSIPTRPNSMHVTKSAAVEKNDQNSLEAMPTSLRPSGRRFFLTSEPSRWSIRKMG